MVELMEVRELVLLSALKAALAEAGIEVFEFDGPLSGLIGDIFPWRLMVHEEDLTAARRVVAQVCPEHLPPAETS
jgi:hypothetical protein